MFDLLCFSASFINLTASSSKKQKQTPKERSQTPLSQFYQLHNHMFLSVGYIVLSAVRHFELRSSSLSENVPACA